MLQHREIRLPDKKFSFSEYSEYNDNDERDRGSLTSQLDQVPVLYPIGHSPKAATNTEAEAKDTFDKS